MEKDENSKFKNSLLQKLDLQLDGFLSEASSEEDFNGKAGQSLVLRLPAGLIGSKRVGLIGLAAAALPAVAYRSLGEAVAAAAKSSQAVSAAIALASLEEIPAELKPSIASAIATGVTLGTFVDNRFKSKSNKPTLKSVDIIGLGSGPENDDKLKREERVCSGIILARELVNAPANVLTPGALAEEALRIASGSAYLTAKILDAEECEKLKMGAFLGVTAASAKPPYFIDLFYTTPTKERKIKLALVGKGLTFNRIELMKNDMAGAAALLGAAEALGQMTISRVQVHFIIAACENMISGSGMRPGDIVTASNGKTIEVNNTDAGGRLTLADAFVYACNQNVVKMVDLATLTGACITALGPSVAGVFTPSDDMAKEVLGASEVSGEKLWRMPMEESYWDSMKSGLADMINTGPCQGDAITAALFLKQFVDEKVKWLHIDVAGPVLDDKNLATGFGVSTMIEWVLLHGRVASE